LVESKTFSENFVVSFDGMPQAGVQRNSGIKTAYLGLRGVEGGTQRRVRGDRFQVPDHTHRVIQAIGHRIQLHERSIESQGRRQRAAAKDVQTRTGVGK
jgi:hypothetical protein